MDDGNKVKEQVKAFIEELWVEKLLTMQKDEQLQSANQKTTSVGSKAM